MEMEDLIQARFVEVLDAVLVQIPAESRPTRVIAVVPGTAPAWDDCCDGQLTARLASLVPVLVPNTTVDRCGISFWRATGEIMLLRCAATMNDQGIAPDPAVLDAEGYESLQDTTRIIRALTATEWVSGISSWVPQGPMGLCRGIAVTFQFRLDSPRQLEQ